MKKNRRAQVQPEAGHPRRVVPAAPTASARVQPAAPTTGPHPLQDVESEVHDLAARVDDLEQTAARAQPLVNKAPKSNKAAPREPSQKTVAKGPTAQSRLQDVLPEVKDLAQKVGGLEQLSQIIETLKQCKE